MGRHSEQLAQRRQALLLKCAAQRQLCTLQGRELQQSLHWVDVALDFCRNTADQFRQRPALGLGLAAAALILKPRRAAALLKNVLGAWQLWSRLAPLLERFRATGAPHDSGQTPAT